jgi:hypothetical protein
MRHMRRLKHQLQDFITFLIIGICIYERPMKAKAVEQAKERLDYARGAVESLSKAKNAKEVGRAWQEYLSNIDAIYEKLRNGAKYNGVSEGWYGRVKHARKTDELLRYLHHARNADLHGLDPSVQRNFNAPIIETIKNAAEVDKSKGEYLLRINTGHPNQPWLIKAKFPSSIRLIPVVDDRDKSVFPVPQSHMGKRLPSMKIPEVAALALKFFERIIAEAETMIA